MYICTRFMIIMYVSLKYTVHLWIKITVWIICILWCANIFNLTGHLPRSLITNGVYIYSSLLKNYCHIIFQSALPIDILTAISKWVFHILTNTYHFPLFQLYHFLRCIGPSLIFPPWLHEYAVYRIFPDYGTELLHAPTIATWKTISLYTAIAWKTTNLTPSRVGVEGDEEFSYQINTANFLKGVLLGPSLISCCHVCCTFL